MTQFVHRSSGLVADTFSLCDRGYLEPGRKADIAVIDLDEFSPQADFQNPERLATGVEHLLVNVYRLSRDRLLMIPLAAQSLIDKTSPVPTDMR